MEAKERFHILIAILTLTLVLDFSNLISGNLTNLPLSLSFAIIILAVNIFAKKSMAYRLDADIEHTILTWSRWGLRPNQHTRKSWPMGTLLPLILVAISQGSAKIMTLLTYEAKALKHRAARRHGHKSYTELTDKHNAYIGAAGIFALLMLSTIIYFIPGLGALSRYAAFYAFWNLLPLSKLDGAQIFFGNRTLYAFLAILTIIFAAIGLTVM
tara:strand:- start:46 stop:684 length:639 start_codon:yes stop_codon:yes gene_type:complete